MALGLFGGAVFCVLLCFSDLFNVANGVCTYMKQDIAYKVVNSDAVLTGKVTSVTNGDSKYFPGIPGAQVIEFASECIYKGPSMDSAPVKIYGVGIFEDSTGKCHNTSLTVNDEAIVYLEKKSNGDLLMKFDNDTIFLTDELSVCGEENPKLVNGHPEPDYIEELCPFYPDECVVYVPPTTKAPTQKPESTPEPTPKPTAEPEPKTTIKYNVNPEVKPQATDGDNGAASMTSMTFVLVLSSVVAFLVV